MQGNKILIVDDDPIILEIVKQSLDRIDAKVFTATDGSEGLHLFYTNQPDLVILDSMMPNVDGREVCRHIRQYSNVPIIMLTALGRDQDIADALNDGADDYITKPFTVNVLLARIKAVLRRAQLPVSSQQKASATTYDDSYLNIDLDQRRVIVEGNAVKLTATEYRLLTYLLQNSGQVLTFKQILENVWGWEYQDNIDYVHVYMSHLRRKLEKNPKKPEYVLTEHGVGYRFESKMDVY